MLVGDGKTRSSRSIGGGTLADRSPHAGRRLERRQVRQMGHRVARRARRAVARARRRSGRRERSTDERAGRREGTTCTCGHLRSGDGSRSRCGARSGSGRRRRNADGGRDARTGCARCRTREGAHRARPRSTRERHGARHRRLAAGRPRRAHRERRRLARRVLVLALRRVLERDGEALPEIGSVGPALRGVERGRARERLLHLVGDVDAERARRGAAARIGGALCELTEMRSLDHVPIAERLDEDERERVHVRRNTHRTDPIVELLRRAVGRREDLDLADGLRARAHVEGAVVHQLRDAEVEHLHLHAVLRGREEEVAGIEITMRDALRVRVGEAVGGGAEELHHLVEGAPLLTERATDREIVLHRATFEPLEDHVRDERAGSGRLRGAGRDAAHHVQVALREPIEDAALVTEPLHERVDERGSERRGKLQALDRDGLVEALVMAAIDRTEPTFADELVDAELAVEDLTDEPEGVRCAHARTVSPLRGGRRAHVSGGLA